jgi:hypothetical protein
MTTGARLSKTTPVTYASGYAIAQLAIFLLFFQKQDFKCMTLILIKLFLAPNKIFFWVDFNFGFRVIFKICLN